MHTKRGAIFLSPLGRENIVTCVLVLCLQIHANCRIRRVYFSDRLYSEEELPAEFKLYLPVQVIPSSLILNSVILSHLRPRHYAFELGTRSCAN